MIPDPLNLLLKPIRYKTWVLSWVFAAYIGLSFYTFFKWVNPTLDGRVDQHIAADSGTYMSYAESLREGRVTPEIAIALSSFPNTLWIPVLLALLFKSTFAIVLLNFAIFFVAMFLFNRSCSFSMGTFVFLLLLNATTTISLLSVNKEIVDLLAAALFLCARNYQRRGMLLLVLLLALLNRFEICAVMLIFILVNSRLNPLQKRRVMSLVLLVAGLSVSLPLAASHQLSERFEEANGGRTIVFLDSLEMHYLYGIAVIPKIAENLFGELMNVSKWETSYKAEDLANSYILLSNNLATAIVMTLLIKKRLLTVQSDRIFLAVLACILMAVSLVIQPRYFYFSYVLFCLEAARPSLRKPALPPVLSLPVREGLDAPG